MTNIKYARLLATTVLACSVGGAFAANFNIPSGDLDSALDAYSAQSGVRLLVSNVAVRSAHTAGVKGNLSDSEALSRILRGTGFVARPDSSGVIGIVREAHSAAEQAQLKVAATPLAATTSGASLETVTVTSSKIG